MLDERPEAFLLQPPRSATARLTMSVSIATFNNKKTLERCLASWEKFASGLPVEIIVIEDGCKDDTADFLAERQKTPWGRKHLRWVHEGNVHELACTNRGFREGTGNLLMTWQDDMFLQNNWFIPELFANFRAYPDLGLLSLSRGFTCTPLEEPILRWEDLTDGRRLKDTIGPAPYNWFRLQEIDIVIRPWVVRRQCLDVTGLLDEAFRPTEWDEADLCYRIRRAGWRTATHAYERLGCYEHLGSTTISRTFSDKYKAQVLRNGLLFHERWDGTIRQQHPRKRKTWWRRLSLAGGLRTVARILQALVHGFTKAGKSDKA